MPKSGVAMCSINDHRMVTFGGSQDDDDDDELNSEAQDDMNFYDTKTQRWFTAVVKGNFSLRVAQSQPSTESGTAQ